VAAAAVCATLFGFVLACGDNSAAPATAPPPPGTSTDAGGLAEAGGDSGLVAAPDMDLTLAHVADVPCVARGGASTVIYPASARPPAFQLLGKAGPRRVATTSEATGFILMDLDGSHASDKPIAVGDLSRAAGGTSNVAVASLAATGVSLSRFDPDGKALGNAAPISPDKADDVFVGRSGDLALVVWTSRTYLRARALDAAGAAGPNTFDLDTDTKDSASVAIAPGTPGSEYLVVWSKRRASDFSYRLLSARADAKGLVGIAHKIGSGSQELRVVQVVPVNAGFAMLAEIGGAPAVVPLDSYGRLSGPAQVLDGVDAALGLAAHAGALGVVAVRKDQTRAFRPLDASGHATGPWVCFDAPAPGTEASMTIDDDPNGWSVLYRANDDSMTFLQFDRAGTGMPSP
jgi:hypothetical protein